MRAWPALIVVAAMIVVACGCDMDDMHSTADLWAVPGVTYAAPGEPAGLHFYRRWSSKVAQGAFPDGEVAFKNLAALGFSTVLSVDGAVPDVELAQKHGLRYVHVPVGYDGIDAQAQLAIVKTMRTSKGPVYVHCHHGTHRGPAAAMLCRMSEDGTSPSEAEEGLVLSGTSRKYEGLWDTVRTFEPPTEKQLAAVSADLPSKVLPTGLRQAMVEVSSRWERVKLSQKAGWKKPRDHPDISPPHEARMLWELFREMARNDPESQAKGDAFVAYMKQSEEAAIELEKAIRGEDYDGATRHRKVLRKLCLVCHKDFRD